MSVVSMRQLLEAGVHFGHQTRRWNPKMERYILTERNGIYIIDIQQTIAMLERAYNFVRDSVAKGGSVLFVGTKKQAQEAIETQAQRVTMPYVNYRWLGGMLTNFETIKGRLARLRELEELIGSETMERLPKKEGLQLQREYAKLEQNLGGIRGMTKLPSAIWIVDTVKEEIAVKEANRLGIPVVAVVDTNCDPDVVQYVIPGNDDAIRSGALLTKLIADAVAEGHQARAARSADDVVAEQAAAAAAAATGPSVAEPEAEPLTEWEIALQQEEAAAAAAQASGATPDVEPEPEAAPGAQASGATPDVEPEPEAAPGAQPPAEPEPLAEWEQALRAEQAAGAAGEGAGEGSEEDPSTEQDA